jgi:tripartite-type tricarboxylate transporter receptor subunit TctC
MPPFIGKRLTTCLLVLLCALTLPTDGAAQDSYFKKSISVIVPYGAGSNLTVARLVAPALQKRLGVPIGVLSVPGPNGWNQVYRANPDGYTIGVGDMVGEYAGNLANPMPYNPKEFEVLGTLSSAVSLLAVGAHTNIKTFDEFVAAGQNGKKLRYASFGVSASLTQAVLLSVRKNFVMTRVMIGSPRDTVLATVRGDADFGILGIRLYLDQMQAKQVVPILVWGKQPDPLAPGVPTLTDLGLADLDPVTSHRVIFAPPRTPPVVVKALNDALSDVLSSPEIIEQFKAVHLETNHKLGSEFRSMLNASFEMADKNKDIIVQQAR